MKAQWRTPTCHQFWDACCSRATSSQEPGTACRTMERLPRPGAGLPNWGCSLRDENPAAAAGIVGLQGGSARAQGAFAVGAARPAHETSADILPILAGQRGGLDALSAPLRRLRALGDSPGWPWVGHG